MKKTIGIVAASALAIAAFSAPVAAAPNKGADAGEAYCFGQVHRLVNTAGAAAAFGAPDNVGQLVRGLGGGQAKNSAAKALFCTVA